MRETSRCVSNKLNSDDNGAIFDFFAIELILVEADLELFEREVREIGVEIKEIGFSKKIGANTSDKGERPIESSSRVDEENNIPLFEEFVVKPSVVHVQDGMNMMQL